MNRSSFPPRERARVRHAAFTLIDLQTVIAIILVLAGLLLHVAGGANTKASLARAQAEIQAMSTGLESYKSDNGTYPRYWTVDASVTSDALNAQTDTDPTNSKYKDSGKVLYQALSGASFKAGGPAFTKGYMQFKPGQLYTAGLSTTEMSTATRDTYIVDPFGIPYGYSTANLLAQDTANTSATPGATPNPASGYNPTFDLWSTGGYGASGKPYPTGITSTAYSTLWVKNW